MPAVAPFGYQYAATSFPFGTLVKPGGNVVAYVRSTGAQEGDDPFAASGLLVSTIDAGCNRCRSGQRDIVVVLPGHVETFTAAGAIWPSLKAGTQIIGAANAGGSSAPTVNLNGVGSSIALNVADVTVHGLNIVGGAVLTAGVVVTARGVTVSGCFINSSAAALAANNLIQVTGAANFSLLDNVIVADSTGAIVAVSVNTTLNLNISGNLIRQTQGTSGGVGISIANTLLISGFICDNYIGSATNLGAGAVGTLITYAGTNPVATLFCMGNLGSDNGGSATANAGIIVPDANADG